MRRKNEASKSTKFNVRNLHTDRKNLVDSDPEVFAAVLKCHRKECKGI